MLTWLFDGPRWLVLIKALSLIVGFTAASLALAIFLGNCMRPGKISPLEDEDQVLFLKNYREKGGEH